METNGLTAQEILASSDAAGDLEGKVSTVIVDGISCPPTADETRLVDLEPFQASDGGGLRIGNFGHVDNLRTGVSTSVPFGGDGSASSDTANGGSRSGTVNIANLLYISLLFSAKGFTKKRQCGRLTMLLEFTSTTGLLLGGRRTQAVLPLRAVSRI